MVDYELWLNMAISKTGGLAEGTQFVLKDLFDGIKWSELTNGEKRELGRQFKVEVNRGMVPGITCNGKAMNNSTLYRKME
jgi:hypothetical protein